MKLPTVREALLIITSLLVLGVVWQHNQEDSQDTEALRTLLANRDKELKDTKVALMSKTADWVALKNVKEAAKILTGGTGRVIAGVAIQVAKHDTTIIHDTIQTIVKADSTRVGMFRDSTFAGIVDATVTAPPCCAPLKASLKITRPAFSPEVGIIKVGSQYVATVYWQGEKQDVSIKSSFFDPAPVAPPKHIVPWAEGTYNLDGPHSLRAGIGLKYWGFQIGPTAAQRLVYGDRPTIGVTLRKEW